MKRSLNLALNLSLILNLSLSLALLLTSSTSFATDAVSATADTSPNRVCPTGATVAGVDISEYQPDSTFTQVAQSGRKFSFVKATEGQDVTNIDFSKHWPDAKAAGMVRGAYHYFIASDDPTQQADFFLSTMGQLESSDLPPMLDWEVSKGVDAETVVERAKIWLERVEASTGRTPIIYTGPAYWRTLKNTAGFEHYPLFIADTNVLCPDVPAPWTNWTFWQHAIGKTPGIVENSDQDLFNGLMGSLEALVRAAGL
jgi:lysozyme